MQSSLCSGALALVLFYTVGGVTQRLNEAGLRALGFAVLSTGGRCGMRSCIPNTSCSASSTSSSTSGRRGAPEAGRCLPAARIGRTTLMVKVDAPGRSAGHFTVTVQLEGAHR